MDQIVIDDIAELGNLMYEMAYGESTDASAVLMFDDAVKLIKWLVAYEDITVGSIDIENEDYNGYDKEFYISLDSSLVLDVFPAKDNDGYVDVCTDVILYGGDTSSKLAIQNECPNKYEIVINDCCGDCCCDCSNCPHRDSDDQISRVLELLDYIFNT